MTSKRFKVIIAGSRHFDYYELLEAKMDELLAEKVNEGYTIEIVSGCCPTGADYHGEEYSHERFFDLKTFPANWTKHGKAAGPIRNMHMARYADACVVFWDGKSRGSKNMIDEAKKAGIPTRVVYYDAY